MNFFEFGFKTRIKDRSLHATLTALLQTNDSWCVNIDRGLLNGVIFIDLKKAVYTIDHEIILKNGVGDPGLVG